MLDRRRPPRSGLPFRLLLIGLAVIVVVSFGKPVLNTIVGYIDGADRTEMIGTAPDQLLIATTQKAKLERCQSDEIIRTRQCDKTKVVIISAAKMPFIARNISLAWRQGKPALLTLDRPGSRTKKYRLTCRGNRFTKKYPDGSCDEYPFASTVQGGEGARTDEVPSREQHCQGGTLRMAYRREKIAPGDSFVVVISRPDLVPQNGYQGRDTAKETGTCEI